MKYPLRIFILILVVTVLAAALRLPRLNVRAMHTDEAVHADKFGTLLEKGQYWYDRFEYHGPTLNYFSLIPAWLGAKENYVQVTEFTLRIVPVFFGILLVFLFTLLSDGLGKTAVVTAAILTAISPAFVFYSRYYIQEMLLVCFTFALIACGYRYTRNKKIGWAIATGIFAGVMHATKETSIIAFGAIAAAIVLTLLLRPNAREKLSIEIKTVTPSHIIAFVVSAAIVSALFYSSFFSNPVGIIDSFRTYATYFNRAGQNQLHIHPWYYYLKMLLYTRYGDGPIWSEAFIVILACIALVVMRRKQPVPGLDSNLLTFFAAYTVIMTVIYSIIPYKTPWCMLGFLHGMIILAAIALAAITNLRPSKPIRAIILVVLSTGGIGLLCQSIAGNYKYYQSTCNPYVYAHSTNDVYVIKQRLEDVLNAQPRGKATEIHVICTDDDYWPLPWYFRSFQNVGWFNSVKHQSPNAPIVITSMDLKDEVLTKLYNYPQPGSKDLYVPLFDSTPQLRPQVRLVGLIKKQFQDRFIQANAESIDIEKND